MYVFIYIYIYICIYISIPHKYISIYIYYTYIYYIYNTYIINFKFRYVNSLCVYVLHNDKKQKTQCLTNFCILLIINDVCESLIYYFI